MSFIQTCRESKMHIQNYFEDSFPDPKEIVRTIIPMGVVSASISINNRCNYHCKHCYIHDGIDFQDIGPEKFTLERALEISNDLKGNIGLLVFPAMEPLLTDLSREILSTIVKEVGQSTKIGVVTNCSQAQLLSQEQVNILNNNLEFFSVSLESGIPKINDLIRGNGTYNKTIAGIKYLTETGLNPDKFTLQATLHPEVETYSQINSLCELAEELGISRISISSCVNTNPISNISHELTYYKKKYSEVIQFLREIDTNEKYSSLKIVLYTTYENPIPLVALSDILRTEGIQPENYKYNPFEIALYTDIPKFNKIQVVGEMARWPMEEAIYPRITSAEGHSLLNIKDTENKYDAGSAITYCFGYQRDDTPIAYWMPGLYQWLNNYFIYHGKELVDKLDVPSTEQIISVDPKQPRTQEEYFHTVAETLVSRVLQKTAAIRNKYIEIYSLSR